jgi:DNA-binding CsgD family transcriptional regulator
VRSAVYAASSLAGRTRVHLALAGALQHDPDRAVTHRAAAALGHDEQLAEQLEESGRRHRARGATGRAMSVYERAAQLSAEPQGQGRRLAMAAESALWAGDRIAAEQLIAQASALATDPVAAAELLLPELQVRLTADLPGREVDDMLHLAGQLGAHPAHRTLALQVAAMQAYAFVDGSGKRRRVEEAILATGLDPADTGQAQALALVAPQRHAARLTPLVRKWVTQAMSAGNRERMIVWGGTAESLRLLPVAAAAFGAAVEDSGRSGSVTDHCMAMLRYASVRVSSGALTESLAAADQAFRLARELDIEPQAVGAAAVSARVHAWRGDAGAVASALAIAGRQNGRGHPTAIADAAWAAGSLALSQNRPAEAARALLQVAGYRVWAGFMIGDLAEAAHRLGGTVDITEVLERTEGEAADFDSDLLRHLVLRARALTLDEDLFAQALAVPGEQDHPLEWARTRLAYGEWLRRRRQAVLARPHLSAAAEAFSRDGATPWAERAAVELRAAGGRTGPATDRPAVPGLATLTPQESQIARLAATGIPSREIADQLFMSPRTVAAHLYRVYPKLGVRNRAELAALLASDDRS